jgi:hypothetical protein
MKINDLKQALNLYIEKWNDEKNKTNNRDEETKLNSMIFLAQWIVNSKKGYGVDITRILDEANAYKIEKEV